MQTLRCMKLHDPWTFCLEARVPGEATQRQLQEARGNRQRTFWKMERTVVVVKLTRFDRSYLTISDDLAAARLETMLGDSLFPLCLADLVRECNCK
jgi:hypothetical protein